MKYRIVIRAFSLRRDVASSLVLAELLKRRGCEVAVCCVRNYRHLIQHWKPHAVIINTVGKVAETLEYAPDSKIIFWPGEGGEAEENSDAMFFHKFGFYDYAGLILIWGDYTRRVFEKYFPNCGDKVKVCGNPRLDLVRYSPEVKREEKIIGALGRFNGINYFDRRPTLSAITVRDEMIQSIKAQCEQFRVLYLAMKHIIDNTDFSINLRPHPLENPGGYNCLKNEFGARFEVDDSMDISRWMGRMKYVLTPASTTFLEAYMLKTPIINIDKLARTTEDVFKESFVTALSFENASNPRNMEELMNVISAPSAPFSRSETLENHLKDFHNIPQGKSAIMNAAEEIMKFLKNSSFKPVFHAPRFLLDMRDLAVFYKTMLFDGSNHPNFNYKKGYHKIPKYLHDIVDNIESNNIVCTGL